MPPPTALNTNLCTAAIAFTKLPSSFVRMYIPVFDSCTALWVRTNQAVRTRSDEDRRVDELSVPVPFEHGIK